MPEDFDDAPWEGIARTDKQTGWVYPFNPHPKQKLASEYDVDELLFGGAAGPGKDLYVGTPVFTAHGWSTQGRLRVGDQVLAVDGSWTTVTAAYGVEANPCFAVVFSTGETLVAGQGHLWTVRTNGHGAQTVNTAQLHAAHQAGRKLRMPCTPYDKGIRVLDVYPTPSVPTRCVAVDHPEKLYLVGQSLIPTHNTDWMLAEAVNTCLAVPNAKVLLLRNTFGELNDEIIPRLTARIPPWVGKIRGSSFIFYNNARIRLGYLERDDNKRRYIGAEYVMICYDELTLMPWSAYEFLRSRVRATGQIAKDLAKAGLRPRIIATSNPGGAYHAAVKEHFVDAAPPGKITRDTASGLTRVYVPATIQDNPSMPANYRKMLESLPAEKRKALLEGSWDVAEGVRFSQFSRNVHVIDPEDLPLPPLSGARVIGVDYGFADPFAAVWMIKLADDLVLVYRELVRTELTARQQAELVAANTTTQEFDAGLTVHMDPSMWRRDNAMGAKTPGDAPPPGSPAYEYEQVLGMTPRRAINNRVHGASVLDEKLRVRPDGWPRILIYSTCINLIRSIPTLQRSTRNPDDVATNPKQDDHAYDALRYGLMALEPRDPMVRGVKRRYKRPGGTFVTAGLSTKKF